jgi:ribosomal protein L34
LQALADDLHERGGLDLSECHIDGTFVIAKKGAVVATRRGKGTKVMAVADSAGLPVAVHVTSASPHEVTLVEETLAKCFVTDKNPARLIGDKAYDSDQLDFRLAVEHGIEMIAPHRLSSGFRKRPKTQDGRVLRRYKTKLEGRASVCMAAEFPPHTGTLRLLFTEFLGFVQLGCMMILLRRCL